MIKKTCFMLLLITSGICIADTDSYTKEFLNSPSKRLFKRAHAINKADQGTRLDQLKQTYREALTAYEAKNNKELLQGFWNLGASRPLLHKVLKRGSSNDELSEFLGKELKGSVLALKDGAVKGALYDQTVEAYKTLNPWWIRLITPPSVVQGVVAGASLGAGAIGLHVIQKLQSVYVWTTFRWHVRTQEMLTLFGTSNANDLEILLADTALTDQAREKIKSYLRLTSEVTSLRWKIYLARAAFMFGGIGLLVSVMYHLGRHPVVEWRNAKAGS